MKKILQLFLVGLIIFSLTNCSKDDDSGDPFMAIKQDLIGTWANVDDKDDQLTFYGDNSIVGNRHYRNNEYFYGFVSLDTIAFFKEPSGHRNSYAFEFSNLGRRLTLKKFRTGIIGTERYDYTFRRID
jgi:hypothetical protein